MPYGIIKVDQVTFTNAGVDQTISVSGIVASISGNITATGTISGDVIRGGTLVSGATVTGTAGQFGTITGNTAGFTTVTGTTITGTTLTVASGTFTGNSTAAAFIPTGSTVPTNGVYLPSANNVAISTNGVERVEWGTSEVVFNDGGENYDFRIEGDTNANLFFVDASTDRVGIGTSAPQAQLQVLDRIKISDSTQAQGSLQLGDGASTSFNVGLARWNGSTNAPGAGGLGYFSQGTGNSGGHYFYTGDAAAGSQTARMTIAPGGNVGIGTTSPAFTLDVIGTAIRVVKSGDASNPRITLTPVSGNAQQITPYGDGDATECQLAFHAGTAGTEAARIDSSGRLLVGTSSARSNFFNTSGYAPQFQIEGANNSGVVMMSITSGDASLGPYINLARQKSGTIGGNTAVANNDILGNITFQGNDGTEFVEGATIVAAVDGTPGANDMPTRLVFSTTADGASSPTEHLRIDKDGWMNLYHTTDGFQSRSSQGAGTTWGNFVGRHSATSTTNGTISFVVFTNGNVQNTNNSYGAYSDIKLKENIVDANSQWNDLKALRVRNYNFKEGQTHTQIGLVAQEAELVSPGLVSESPDRDEEGNDLGTTTKSVNYSVLYMKAVKALQEAMERIEQLEAKVAALEAA